MNLAIIIHLAIKLKQREMIITDCYKQESEFLKCWILIWKMNESYLTQMREMAKTVYGFGLNIDYFPTNFIVQDDLIFYIDYECNNYMEEWNFENWGIKYWSKTQELVEYMK